MSQLKEALGDWAELADCQSDRVRCLGAGFTQQPQVIDAASELLVQVFGEAGRHARSAVGVAELPRGVPVEIELVAAVRE